MKRYFISSKDAARLKHSAELLRANEQVMDAAISRLIHERAEALFIFDSTWKDIKNKYEIREQMSDVCIDFYTNEVRIKNEDGRKPI